MTKRLKKTHNHHHSPKSKISPYVLFGVVGAVVVLVLGIVIFTRGGDDNDSVEIDPNFTPQVSGAPRVEVVKGEVDHGDVKYNRPVRSEFVIRNVGDSPLMVTDPNIIVEVVEGCCPPKASISSDVLEPGQTAVVSMEYSMHEGMGGQHEFHVHLTTNDPASPKTTFVARSNWIP